MSPDRSPRFLGRVALVTGSSRGLGRAIGLGLAAEGADVVLNSARTPFDGAIVASEATKGPGKAIYVRADISREADVRDLANLIDGRFGRLDVVIHNAADGLECRTSDAPWEGFERAFATNAYALVCLARNLTPLMTKGKILYVSSFGAERAVPGYGIVGASKAAGESLARSLAMELAPDIQVNSLRPAVIPTMSLRSFSHAEDFLEMAAEESPMGLGSLEDIVQSALFLCSSEARFITGQVVNVDGGMGATIFRQSWMAESRPDLAATSGDG